MQYRGALLLLLYFLLRRTIQPGGWERCKPALPMRREALSCIATQAPGHFAQGWGHSCLFRLTPGMCHPTMPRLPIGRAHFYAAYDSNTLGDSIEGGAAPLLERGRRGGLRHGMAQMCKV